MKTQINLENKIKHDEKVMIYQEDVKLLLHVVELVNKTIKDNGYTSEYYMDLLEQANKFKDDFGQIDINNPIFLTISDLPDFINNLAYYRWTIVSMLHNGIADDDIHFDELVNRVRKAQNKVNKLSLTIPQETYDHPGWKKLSPIIYEVITGYSVIKTFGSKYWYVWYPTMDELESLIMSIDELLADPLASSKIFVFRKNAYKVWKLLEWRRLNDIDN